MPVKGHDTRMFPGPGGYLRRSPVLHGGIGNQAGKGAETNFVATFLKKWVYWKEKE
jgi:hypothetical protein